MGSLRGRIKGNRTLRAALFLAQNALHTAPTLAIRRRPATATEARRYRLAAMIRVKDEARFLPEWLAHHVGLGVEHCFIYDNNSCDGIEQVMAPFIERGLATYVHWPRVPASPSSHLDFLGRFGQSSEWVAFFDADEFLVERDPGDLVEVLRTVGHAPAVAINWRYFGSSGHERVPDGLITERFDHASVRYSDHVKVVARPAMIAGHRNSHNFYYRGGRLAVTPEGRRVFGSFATPAQDPRLVLNHYVYRSREDYERKASHGFVDATGAKERARRTTSAEREFHRHNDVQVRLDRRTVERTAAMLRDLGYPAQLYAGSTQAAG